MVKITSKFFRILVILMLLVSTFHLIWWSRKRLKCLVSYDCLFGSSYSAYIETKFLTDSPTCTTWNASVRSSSPGVLCKKGVFRNFAGVFPVNFAKLLRTAFFTKPLRWLFLIIECIIWWHDISVICDYPIIPLNISEYHQNVLFNITKASVFKWEESVFSFTECFQTKKLSCEIMHLLHLHFITLKEYNATVEKITNSRNNENIH